MGRALFRALVDLAGTGQGGGAAPPPSRAGSAGRVIDLFEPVQHIAEKCLASSYTALDATSMPDPDDTHPLPLPR